MMDTKIYLIFILVSTYQPSKNWPFIYHMCAYLVQITVVNCDEQPSNNVNYVKMYFVTVIMQRGWYQFLLIKYNLNTKAEIDICLWCCIKMFQCNTFYRHISISALVFRLYLIRKTCYYPRRDSTARVVAASCLISSDKKE